MKVKYAACAAGQPVSGAAAPETPLLRPAQGPKSPPFAMSRRRFSCSSPGLTSPGGFSPMLRRGALLARC